MEKDLTSGKIMPSIIAFSIPILLGNVLQQLYNMADSIIVGRFVGKDAFAAVGATGSLNFLIIGFVLGMASGLCIPVAHQFGAGDMVMMRKKIASSIYVSIIVGIVLTILTVMFVDPLLVLMKTPDNIFSYAKTYILIIFLGIPATLLYNIPANISRAIGDSRTPLYFLMLAALLNVVLDLIFVCIFHMGVAGTAIATVISQVVSGILCIIYMAKKYEVLQFQKGEWRFEGRSVRQSAVMGVPMGLQFSITAIGSVVIQSAVNTLGSDTVAAVNAAMKTQQIFVQPLEVLGVTIANYCGQNLGAGKIRRIREGIRKSLIASAICALGALIVMNVAVGPLAGLFIKKAEMTDYIMSCIKEISLYNSFFYFLLGSLLVFRYGLQGLGHSMIAMGAGVFEMIARCLIAFFATGYFGFTAICFANPAAWAAANLILIPVYIYVMKQIVKNHPEQTIPKK